MFIDYGNTSKSNDLRKLPEYLENILPCAIHCSLQQEVVPNVSPNTSSTIIKESEFKSYFDDKLTHLWNFELVESSVDVTIVRIFYDVECEQEIMVINDVDEKLPSVTAEKSESVIDNITMPVICAEICWFVSITNFYIQPESRSNEKDMITNELLLADSFPVLHNPKVDAICAAKFSEDDCYYRAQIMAVNEDGGKFFCNFFFK